MKKTLCMLLVLLLTAFFCLTSAGAAEEPMESFKVTGFRVSWPESFRQTKGTLLFSDLGLANAENPVLYVSQFDYAPGDQAITLGLLMASDYPPEIIETILIRGRGEVFIPLAKHGDLYYMYLGLPADTATAVPAEYEEEFRMLLSQIPEALKNAEFFDPEAPETAFIGNTLRFESTDLDGNPVKSEDLFRQNRITLVNLWGTWCPNCEMEMADLARLHDLMQKKGCGIIGIEFESEPIAGIRERAKAFLNKYGVTYPNVLKPEYNAILNSFNMYPTSLFVDSNGRILSEAILGARIQTYIETFEFLLASEESAAPASDPAIPESAVPAAEGVFTVTVTDGTHPLPGVMIKFCNEGPEGICTIQPTDPNGQAVFSMETGKEYEIEVLMAEGYEKPAEISKTTEPGELTLVLKKAE